MWEIENGKEPIAAHGPPKKREDLGEVPGRRGTFWGAEGHYVADPKAGQEVPQEEEEGEGGE